MQNGVNAADSSATFSESQERRIVWLLCLLAAVHVFVFSAAAPFFNNVDEQIHLDLAVKYSQGHLPRSLEPVSTEVRSEEHTSELQSLRQLVCRLLLEKR